MDWVPDSGFQAERFGSRTAASAVSAGAVVWRVAGTYMGPRQVTLKNTSRNNEFGHMSTPIPAAPVGQPYKSAIFGTISLE
jgi:hypothetical protein